MFYLIRGNKIWVFSTMWVLGPICVIVLYKSIKRFEENNKRIEEEWVEYYKAHGITSPHDIRGGQQEPFDSELELVRQLQEVSESELVPQLINVTKPGFICLVRNGVSYLKDKTVKKLVIKHFSTKAKNGVIFITKSALCQLVVLHGLEVGPGFLNAVGLSSWVNPVRNTVSVTTAAYGVYLIWTGLKAKISLGTDPLVFSTNRRIRLIGGIVSLIISLLSLLWRRDPGFVHISSTYIAIDGRVVSRMKARIPEIEDVIILNSKSANKPLAIKSEVPSGICKIPGVAKIYKKCPPKITFTDPELQVEYHNSVNMNDVAKFSIDDNQKFNDLLDIGNPYLPETISEPPKIKAALSKTAKLKAKMVNFLDKFKDPEIIPEDSLWETNDEISSVVKNRIRDKK